jgi:valyl-tRNA synthetase
MATEKYAAYDYADAMEAVERFFWADLCDNYLELVKGRAYGEVGTPEGKRSAQYTLWHCLETVLRLFAPVLPHLTEELYQTHFPGRFAALGSIHRRGNWPKIADQVFDEAAVATGTAGVAILSAIRKVKSEAKVSIKTPVAALNLARSANAVANIEAVLADLSHTVSAQEIVWHAANAVPGTTVALDEAGFILSVELAAPTN